MGNLNDFLSLAGPVLTIIVGLFSAYQRASIARLNDKIENERNLREQWQKYIDGRITDLLKEFSRTETEIKSKIEAVDTVLCQEMKAWSEGQQRFFTDVLERNNEQIIDLYDKKVSKEVCEEKHRWNGIERRSMDRQEKG